MTGKDRVEEDVVDEDVAEAVRFRNTGRDKHHAGQPGSLNVFKKMSDFPPGLKQTPILSRVIRVMYSVEWKILTVSWGYCPIDLYDNG